MEVGGEVGGGQEERESSPQTPSTKSDNVSRSPPEPLLNSPSDVSKWPNIFGLISPIQYCILSTDTFITHLSIFSFSYSDVRVVGIRIHHFLELDFTF